MAINNSLRRTMLNNVRQLDEALSQPSEQLIDSFRSLDGDLLLLGAGGKMGPTFARMARRALDAAGKRSRVIAVSRFTNESAARELTEHGIEIISGDLFDVNFVQNLPEVANVLYLVGMKFGTADDASRTWASNTFVAGLCADRFRASKIVALSTGNVYELVPIESGGSLESDPPRPNGEYPMAAIGRERMFEYFSRRHNTPAAIVRLNYSTELRYGVPVDLAQKIYRGEPVSLVMGYFNTIWQRDACDMILRCFDHVACPPLVINVTGNERLSSRTVCERFGQLFNKPPRFTDAESNTALLSNTSLACKLFGPAPTPPDEIFRSIAGWIAEGGETWNKPTHFEVRDGKF